ncbi:glycosyltransferase family 4 protein [Arthrobacter sp. NPDC057009]|uniref:glycosyltransferase family 4 protein n=1 Tax=Arthrobacter sp. NPDC057009 TaxID=3345996 RepID=UPI003627D266
MLDAAPPKFESYVLTTNTDLGQKQPLDVIPDVWLSHSGAQVYYCSVEKIASFVRAIRKVRSLRPAAIYLNSFFDPWFSIVPQALFRLGWLSPKGLAIAPRGEFSAGALALKKQKKSFYIQAFKLSGLAGKVVWHASAPAEAADIRAIFGPDVSIVIRENDTLLPERALDPVQPTGGPLRAVSLSRLSPKKGIHTLLEGLQSVDANISLDIIGPPEDLSYFERCKSLVASLPPNVRVRFLGAIPHDEIRSRLNQYDVMFCPTKGENFGHVIAEGLSASCPVLCADVTPWSERLVGGGGEIVSPNNSMGWARAVNAYAGTSTAERLRRRLAAAACYNVWRAQDPQAHFFSLLERELLDRSSASVPRKR